MKGEKISIVGAGLVGSLTAILLKHRGFDVSVFEKRPDPRTAKGSAGRSINLALSDRGIGALQLAEAFDAVSPLLIPMKGRMIHDTEGNLTVQPYGIEGQHINSVSRALLNKTLLERAEDMGVHVFFDSKCESVNFEESKLSFAHAHEPITSDLIIGTDGAFSAVRQQLQRTDRFSFSQHYIDHGYKELTIQPAGDDFALEPDFLHIWPRGNFMLIALPNNDKSFTCTLFFPFEGAPSFQSLDTADAIETFFTQYFGDALELMPDLVEQFNANPTSSLVTTSCSPWHRNRSMVIGDAAHAIVPFYGQGMNAGFEDARLFVEMAADMDYAWDQVLPRYSATRKKDADAISELALNNFIEMRDHVGDPTFLHRKKLEAALQKAFPEDWIPLYSMVTFSAMPYHKALQLGKLQQRVLEDVLKAAGGPDLKPVAEDQYIHIVQRFNDLKKADLTIDQ